VRLINCPRLLVGWTECRLAARLTGWKIDIKVLEPGKDAYSFRISLKDIIKGGSSIYGKKGSRNDTTGPRTCSGCGEEAPKRT
jgi:hypothetical protein